MRIGPEDVRHVAALARLEFSEEELERFTVELNRILDYMAKLEEVDTSGVEPMTHAIELTNVMREDRAAESLPREEALGGAPEADKGAFVVPRVI